MEFPSFLLEKEMTDVFVVGLSGDYCINSMVIDAARLTLKTASGLEIKLRTCRSVGMEGTDWDETKKVGDMFVESDELKARLEHKF
jgi:hypothetical protein